jgi:hypothetical protein
LLNPRLRKRTIWLNPIAENEDGRTPSSLRMYSLVRHHQKWGFYSKYRGLSEGWKGRSQKHIKLLVISFGQRR